MCWNEHSWLLYSSFALNQQQTRLRNQFFTMGLGKVSGLG